MQIDIKICGLTNLPDARAALDAGADFLGFVLYAKSPRGISESELRRIVERLPAGARTVGVFVNERPETVARIYSECGLRAVQLHGDEEPDEFAGLNLPVWRAVRVRADGIAAPAPARWPAERYVADAYAPGVYGGTGKTADWRAAAELATGFPVMLAGGLTPENVGEAVRAVRPNGVDVAGGVESGPGKKDHLKLNAFIAAARKASAEIT